MSADEDTHTMLGLYEEVARPTGSMLSAAHQHDWDRLLDLEAGCAHCIESLKRCPVATPLDETARQQKVDLLKRILENDREIRQLIEPWMHRIGHLLGSGNRQCDLARAYLGVHLGAYRSD